MCNQGELRKLYNIKDRNQIRKHNFFKRKRKRNSLKGKGHRGREEMKFAENLQLIFLETLEKNIVFVTTDPKNRPRF